MAFTSDEITALRVLESKNPDCVGVPWDSSLYDWFEDSCWEYLPPAQPIQPKRQEKTLWNKPVAGLE